jgi:ABC-type amino acid transport substrate-binding protein
MPRTRKSAPLLACLLLILLAGLTPLAAATLDQVRSSGFLRLGYRADAKPYSYRDAGGQPAGYIVEICKEVAQTLIREMRAPVRTMYVRVTAEQRFEVVRDRKIDILCDPTSVTMERRAYVDFSIPTFLDGTGVMYRAGKPVTAFENMRGLRYGVLKGTTTADNVATGLRLVGVQAHQTSVNDHREGLNLLTADKIDVYFADRAILLSLLSEGDLPGLEVGRQYFSYETYALALPRGDDAFRLAVDRALADLYRSGKIRALLTKTFGSPPKDAMLEALIAIHSFPER